jgi:predicted Zn-dependent peptidase
MVSYTKTESTVDAIDLALELLGRLREDGFDSDAIASGKNYILGQFPPRLETASQLADEFATLETYGLDPSYVNGYGAAVAAAAGEDIATVIDEVYPDPANLVFVVLGDATVIREKVARYGTVTEMPMVAPHFAPTEKPGKAP